MSLKEYLPRFFEKCGKECGDGWDKLIHALAAVQPACVTVTQVKEKFGGLRVYFDCSGAGPAGEGAWHCDECTAFDKAVLSAERMSYRVCEWCGSDGERRNMKNWLVTLCDTCLAEHEARLR